MLQVIPRLDVAVGLDTCTAPDLDIVGKVTPQCGASVRQAASQHCLLDQHGAFELMDELASSCALISLEVVCQSDVC
jgi:hypothetical protein